MKTKQKNPAYVARIIVLTKFSYILYVINCLPPILCKPHTISTKINYMCIGYVAAGMAVYVQATIFLRKGIGCTALTENDSGKLHQTLTGAQGRDG